MAKSVNTGKPASRKQAIIDEFKVSDKDTGSAYVQVALLTDRINTLAEHLSKHKNDQSSRTGLLHLVGRRRKFLNFIERTDGEKAAKKLKRDIGMD